MDCLQEKIYRHYVNNCANVLLKFFFLSTFIRDNGLQFFCFCFATVFVFSIRLILVS